MAETATCSEVQAAVQRRCAPAAARRVRLQEPDGSAASLKRLSSTWASAKRSAIQQAHSGGGRGPGPDHRAEAGDHEGAQVDRQLQAARRHADRRQSDPAQAAHVRIPGPSGHHRAAARAGLPRPVAEELRWAMEITPWASRNTSCSRRSITTRSTQIWGLDVVVCTTAQGATTKRVPCSPGSASRSAASPRNKDEAGIFRPRRLMDGKKSAVERDKKTPQADEALFVRKRESLKAIANDASLTERGAFQSAPQAAELPRNSSKRAFATGAS